MSTKRQPSKQRRQTQNQKQRAALAARRAAAAGSPPAGKVGTGATPSGASGGSVLSRLRGAPATGRAARAARATPTGRRGSTSGMPPGHRAAQSAVFAAVAAAVVGSFLLRLPVDRNGDPIVTPEARVAEWILSASDAVAAAPDATPSEIADAVTDWSPGGTEPYGQAYWPISLAALLPVLGTGLGFRAVARRSPAKLVNRTMYVTLFGTLLTSQLTLVFLPAVISLAVAAFQVRKAEVVAGAAAAGTQGDEVIDVDEVTEDADRAATDDDATGGVADDPGGDELGAAAAGDEAITSDQAVDADEPRSTH